MSQTKAADFGYAWVLVVEQNQRRSFDHMGLIRGLFKPCPGIQLFEEVRMSATKSLIFMLILFLVAANPALAF